MGIVEFLEQGMSSYCEDGVGLLSTQPINTASNLLIIVAAYFAYRHVQRQGVKSRVLLFLPSLILLTGVGSLLWHGMPNFFTNLADTLPLATLLLISFFFLMNKVFPNRKLVWWILVGFVLIEIPFVFDLVPSLNGFLAYFFALLFGLFIAATLLKKYKSLLPQITFVVILFAVAFFFRTVDFAVCPTFPFGAHFIWHALNALVLYMFIRLLVAVEKQENRFVEYTR